MASAVVTVPVPSSPPADDRFDTAHLAADLKRRTIRGGAVTLSSQGAKFALRLGSAAVLARLLAPADFGLVAMVAVVTGFVEMFKDAGLSMATVQSEKVTHAQVSTLFWINAALGVVVTLVVAALAPALAWFYGEPRLTAVTLALACTTAFGGLSVQHQALLRRRMAFGRLAAIEVLSMSAGIATAVSAASLGYGYWALVAMTAATAVTTAATSFALSGWVPGPPSREGGVGSMLKFGGGLAGFNVTNYLSRNGDNFLIGWWCGAASLGFYSRAYGLLMMPLQQVNAPVASVALPALSRLVTAPDRYRRAYLEIVEKLALATMPMTAFLAATSDWVVTVVLGPRWSPAAAIFAWLAVAGIVQPVSGTVGWLFISQGKTTTLFRWGLFGAVSTLCSFAVGLPFGPIGVAASYAVTGVLVRTPLLFYVAGRSGPIRTRDFYRALAVPAVVAAAAFASVVSVRATFPHLNPLEGLAAAVAAAAVVVSLIVIAHPRTRSTVGFAEVGRMLRRKDRTD